MFSKCHRVQLIDRFEAWISVTIFKMPCRVVIHHPCHGCRIKLVCQDAMQSRHPSSLLWLQNYCVKMSCRVAIHHPCHGCRTSVSRCHAELSYIIPAMAGELVCQDVMQSCHPSSLSWLQN